MTTSSETGTESRPSVPATAATRTESTVPAPGIPDELKPLVQQQLDAVASQRLAWHGEAWPGQGIDWKIEREITDEHRSGGGEEDEAPRWATTLRLTMPNLGEIDARLGVCHEEGHGRPRARDDSTQGAFVQACLEDFAELRSQGDRRGLEVIAQALGHLPGVPGPQGRHEH